LLTIRPAQFDAFRLAALRQFEDEMVRHLARFSPTHSRGIGEEAVRHVIRLGVEHAAKYGFTYRGPVRFYIELMFLFGSHFDSDPQLPLAARALLHDEPRDQQMTRADRLYRLTLDYNETVAGPGNSHARRAIRSFRELAAAPLPFDEQNLVGGLLDLMWRLYPERCAYVGEDALRALIDEALSAAPRRSLTSIRGVTLCCLLMFELGHGVLDDPLYPWISRTLSEGVDASPDELAARLEHKTIAYLDLILRRLREA
jgi:hypothetical protein